MANQALDAEPPIASSLKSMLIGRRPVNANVRPHNWHMRMRELTIANLMQTPLWRQEGGDDDNDAVFPAVDFVDVDHVGYIAATKFITSDCNAFVGSCSPQDPSGMDYGQPVLITNDSHIRLWHDDLVPIEQLDAMLALLGKKRSEVFPRQCRCLVPFEGKMSSAIITDLNAMAEQTDEREPE